MQIVLGRLIFPALIMLPLATLGVASFLEKSAPFTLVNSQETQVVAFVDQAPTAADIQ